MNLNTPSFIGMGALRRVPSATCFAGGLFAAAVGSAQVIAPQLTALTLTSANPLTAGSDVSYDFTITPGSDPTVDGISMTLLDSQQHMYVLAATGASGSVFTPTSSFLLNGPYTIYVLGVLDSDNYQTGYTASGSITYTNGGTGPATTSLPFSSLGFMLTGAPYSSITSPLLTSFTLSSSANLIAGADVTYSYAITPGTLGLTGSITVTLFDPTGSPYGMTGSISLTGTGTLTLTSNNTWLDGSYTVGQIYITDGYGDETYLPTTSNIFYERGGMGPPTQSISFPSLGFTLSSGVAPTPTPTPSLTPTPTPTPTGGSAPTPTPTPAPTPQVTPTPTPTAAMPSARLINLSTRAQVGTGGNILIPGFFIAGSGTETLLIRADGPALTGFSVSGVLAQPILSVFDSTGRAIATNTGWGTNMNPGLIASTSATVGAFALAQGSADCALIVSLPAGAYTAQVTGVNNTTGVALAEIYEVSSTGTRLMNISTRAQVGMGANLLIPGFVVSGSGREELLVRADGPGLAQFSVSGVLAQPSLSVFDNSADVVATNTGWGSAPDSAQIASTAAAVGAFALQAGSADSAQIVTLPPGSYTIQVSGAGNSTGVALAEVYEVPQN